MKKKVRIIVIIVALLAVAIYIVSFFYPPTKGDDTAGTIGKADKFRKGQFTAEDILLRDDILKDTAAVGKTLDQILTFAAFMQQEKAIIDSVWIKQIKKSCPSYPGCTSCVNCEQAVKLLEDYSSFVQNNKETVQSTIAVLLAAYNGKQKDYTMDVGMKMLSFVQFVDEMIKRDSAFTNAIRLVDQYITKEKTTDKKRQAALNKLKQVRDHMVIDNLLFAMKTGDKKQSEVVANINLCSAGTVANVVSSIDPVVNSVGTIGNAALQSSAVINNIYSAVGYNAVANIGNTGIFSAGRIDAAFTNAAFLVVENGNVVRNVDAINSVVGLDNVSSISASASTLNLADVIGVGYNNVVNSAPLNIVVSNAGTVFNSNLFVE